MNFALNQARHLYVAKKSAAKIEETSTVGTVAVITDTDKNHMYLQTMGAKGILRSDLIDLKNVLYVKATSANSMKAPLKKVKIVLNDVNDGEIISGQDYLVRLTVSQFITGDGGSTYVKYGVVRGYKGMTASKFYVKLALSFAKNFYRDNNKFFKFSLAGESAVTAVTADTKEDTLTGEYTGVIIEEVEQDWVLGVMPQDTVQFTVTAATVTLDGSEVEWATITKEEPTNFVGNGKRIADLEYFCMGERGDQYRNVGFPNVIQTTYLVDPTKTYDVIDIHYAFVDSNEGAQKSEKTMTIAIPTDANATGAILTAINTATGLSVELN
jgi:hypothetical protein